MTEQVFADILNHDFNVTLAVITLVIGLGTGRIWGWKAGTREATSDVQHALDRAARDIRLYRENIYGTVPGCTPAKALREAEQIVAWRTAPNHIATSPQGVSRMTPPAIPRSRSQRRQLERHNQRTLIAALGLAANQRPDDTYTGPIRNQMAARYTRPRWTPKETADAEAP